MENESLSDLVKYSVPDTYEKLIKSTDTNGQRIGGYVTPFKISGESSRTVDSFSIQKRITDVQKKIVNIWDEILDQNDDSIAKENLIAIINDSLEELWTCRSFREREFKKYIVLLQTITKSEQLNDKSVDLLKEFGFLFQTLKIPKITRQDIKSAKKVITKLGLDLYAPFKSKPKYQLIIKELNE